MALIRTRPLFFCLLAALMSACGESSAPGIARGEAIFDNCVPCHGEAGAGDQTLGAPSIAGLPQWYLEAQLQKFQGAIRGAHPFDTVGIRMKSMALTLDVEGDLESVAEYVASLPPVPPDDVLGGDPAAGKEVFEVVCAECHALDGWGLPEVNAPPIVRMHDWYLLSQLQKFKAGWRGTHPDDATGATMLAGMPFLPDQATMENVIAYIETLR